jgi:Kazal-type serine protease inhibitor domain
MQARGRRMNRIGRAAAALVALAGLLLAPAQGVAHGRICGGSHRRGCAAGQYCDAAAKATVGVCHARPKVCPDVFIAVCGRDGKVYANACQANRAGVSVAHLGYCGAMPGPGGAVPIAPTPRAAP